MGFKLLLPLSSFLLVAAAAPFGSPFYSFTTNYGAHPYSAAAGPAPFAPLGPFAAAPAVAAEPYNVPAHYNTYAAVPAAPAPIAHAAAPIAHAAAPIAHAAAPVVQAAPVAAVYAEPQPVQPPVIHSSQYHAQDELGSVEYGYSNINSAKQESRDEYGNVAGTYSYVDAYGVPKTVSYIADAYGFRVTGANNLPVAPVDTPEVAHARLAHFDALHAAAVLTGH